MKIGPIHIPAPSGIPLALAPMDDVTGMPFRRLCKRLGADLLYTEFIQCALMASRSKKVRKRLVFDEEERPIGVQLYGGSDGSLERAIAIAEAAAPDFIDINCGCSIRKIARRGDGAGLLRDLQRLEDVLRRAVNATRLPVTMKTRLGWDDRNLDILDIARIAEQSGCQAIALHCRTREQGYGGDADWSWLERVKAVVTIPVIGNGDVRNVEDARRMAATGCDAIMIGRAAVTNPWLFAEIKADFTRTPYQAPSLAERLAVCRSLLRKHAAHSGERRAVLQHRRLYRGYLGGLPDFEALWADLMTLETLEEVDARLERAGEEV